MNADRRSSQSYLEDFFDVSGFIFPVRNARESHYNLLHDTPTVHVRLLYRSFFLRLMQKTTADVNRTARLLALFKQGDSAFNARNQAGMDAVHHPDMIAHIPGYPKPIYGAAAHAKAMQQFIEIFPDIHVYNEPYRVQFGSGDWITTITRTTGTFTGKMVLPDGKVVPPTGKAFDLPDFVQVVKFEGDRVIEIYAVWDSGLFASQIGLA